MTVGLYRNTLAQQTHAQAGLITKRPRGSPTGYNKEMSKASSSFPQAFIHSPFTLRLTELLSTLIS
jgi:hypothetical protein